MHEHCMSSIAPSTVTMSANWDQQVILRWAQNRNVRNGGAGLHNESRPQAQAFTLIAQTFVLKYWNF